MADDTPADGGEGKKPAAPPVNPSNVVTGGRDYGQLRQKPSAPPVNPSNPETRGGGGGNRP